MILMRLPGKRRPRVAFEVLYDSFDKVGRGRGCAPANGEAAGQQTEVADIPPAVNAEQQVHAQFDSGPQAQPAILQCRCHFVHFATGFHA